MTSTLDPPPATRHLPPSTRRPRSGPKGIRAANSSGLTLIELLSAFTILAILVALLAVTFNTTTDAWHTAQDRTRVVAQARAIMDAMAQNLRQAVATTNFPITIEDDLSAYGATNNAIQFVRILPAVGTNQYAIEAIRYGVNSSNGVVQLVQWVHRLSVVPPENPPNHLPGSMDDDHLSFANTTTRTLADGLAALRFSPPTDTNAMSQADAPVWSYIDVYFELLNDEDEQIAATYSGTNQTLFVERHALRFSQRVFLPAVNRWNLP